MRWRMDTPLHSSFASNFLPISPRYIASAGPGGHRDANEMPLSSFRRGWCAYEHRTTNVSAARQEEYPIASLLSKLEKLRWPSSDLVLSPCLPLRLLELPAAALANEYLPTELRDQDMMGGAD
ncbi:hypothetical protein STEG23_037751 [Scotinomys teguina]